MKKLTALFAGALLSISSIYSQELKLSIDPYEFIPRGAENVNVYGNPNWGHMQIYWWDKNKDGKQQKEETYIDINGDGIPDTTQKDFCEWYEKNKEEMLAKQNKNKI